MLSKSRYGDQDYEYADPEKPYQEEYAGGSFQNAYQTFQLSLNLHTCH